MKTVMLSKEQARQFALDIYDQLIQDIKAQEATERADAARQSREKGRVA